MPIADAWDVESKYKFNFTKEQTLLIQYHKKLPGPLPFKIYGLFRDQKAFPWGELLQNHLEICLEVL